MTTSSRNQTCQRCGAVIPAASTEAMCPACLLSGALDWTDDQAETLTVAPTDDRPPAIVHTDFPCEFGHYRLLRLLGRGGMGTVYEAEEIATGRRLALKMLAHQLDSPEMRQRFLREGRLAARVNHPNSLYIFGSEEVEGLPVITMEIAGSGTLKDQLKQRGPLPITEAVDAMLDVIDGLQSAFVGGVLHRDIKPSNCFVSPDGAVKVGDFGLSVSTLAKTDTFVTAHGRIMGTPAYASPEQLRGDALDARADIYSVGATLFTLLTDRAPFEGDNAVQVVANAVNQDPLPLAELRQEVPPGLVRIVMRCLAKDPERRYEDYQSLREALLPFSSLEPEPASMKVRAGAGWIDYLMAFLPPYLVLMFTVGGEALFVRPLIDRTLFAWRYYILLLAIGFLYFAILEGFWGAGLGKWLKGLRAVRRNGQRPGFGRSLARIAIPILSIEIVRIPICIATIRGPVWSQAEVIWFVVVCNVCAWIPVLLALRAREENGFATAWDILTGTRVIVKPAGSPSPSTGLATQPELPAEDVERIGPFGVLDEWISADWLVAFDPVLRRRVWLIRRISNEATGLSRQSVARSGRLRWLQDVEAHSSTWDAYEAPVGVPLTTRCADGKRIPWAVLRHWLHNLATELWSAGSDDTIPAQLSLDHVWLREDGRAILLDQPWPDVAAPAKRIDTGDLAGQQRFLSEVANCVESANLPLHARAVLRNLSEGKFEKLSFLAGTLRGLLDRPADVSRGIRAASIFMLPTYVWVMVYVGRYHDKPPAEAVAGIVLSALVVLTVVAIAHLLAVPFRSTAGQAIFRLAVVNARGEPATASHLLVRWAVVWLPIALLMICVLSWVRPFDGPGIVVASALIVLWLAGAMHAALHAHQALHDRLARTRVVRR